MSFRFPHASDPNAHKEDEWTAMRMASASNKQVAGSTVAGSPTGKTPESPARRRLVFTDPIAFRYAIVICRAYALLMKQIPRRRSYDGGTRATWKTCRLRVVHSRAMGMFANTSHLHHRNLHWGPEPFRSSWSSGCTCRRGDLVRQVEGILQSSCSISCQIKRHPAGEYDGHKFEQLSFSLDSHTRTRR